MTCQASLKGREFTQFGVKKKRVRHCFEKEEKRADAAQFVKEKGKDMKRSLRKEKVKCLLLFLKDQGEKE